MSYRVIADTPEWLPVDTHACATVSYWCSVSASWRT